VAECEEVASSCNLKVKVASPWSGVYCRNLSLVEVAIAN
jgi:hypothetical protein